MKYRDCRVLPLPPGKLKVGGKICHELLAKLISDMESMREESVATVNLDVGPSM